MLCNNGYISVIHDHRGHGKSVKDAVDLGYFYDDSGKAIIEDAHQVTTWMKERYGGELPYHLFGHSMGSLVVRCYLKKYDDELDSLIVCGSPSENKAAKAAGFQSIRIPVSYLSKIDDNNGYKIDSACLDHVQEVVDYCVQNDMYAIVNMHGDGYTTVSGSWLLCASSDQTLSLIHI